MRLLEQPVECGPLVQDDEARTGVVGVDALNGTEQEGVVHLYEGSPFFRAVGVAIRSSEEWSAVFLEHVRDHDIAESEVV